MTPEAPSRNPQTKRGRVLLQDLGAFIPVGLWTAFRQEQVAGSILRIEAEAAQRVVERIRDRTRWSINWIWLSDLTRILDEVAAIGDSAGEEEGQP